MSVWLGACHQALDVLLFRLSTYLLPLLIGSLSVLALLAWPTHYPSLQGQTLSFQVAEDRDGRWGPTEALAAIAQAKPAPVSHRDTQLSTRPFWLLMGVAEHDSAVPQTIEFSSRHATEMRCWDARTLTELGRADRGTDVGPLALLKAGFALALPVDRNVDSVVCEAHFVGPARMRAQQWDTPTLQRSTQQFHNYAGLLDGGVMILALFVFLTGLINRNSTYVLFAAWLAVNLRMAALSAGWDYQWLGHLVPVDWLLPSRLITVAVYYVTTITLFRTFFKDELDRVGYFGLMRLAQWTCLPLLLLSATLSYASFLPLIWVSTALNIVVLVFFLARILWPTRSSVAMWYAASISITLFASLYEVISAALGVKGLIESVNSVTAALSSSLMAALAIAAQMKQEHEQRLEIQAELQHTFEAMPIGLFTLDMQGRFMSANPALLQMLGEQVLEPGQNDWFKHLKQGAWTHLHQMLHQQKTVEIKLEGLREQGDARARRYMVRATLARDKIEGSLQDVTEKSLATDNLQFLANNDPLTKVLNRRGVEKALDAGLAGAREGRPLALAYLDLDRFKLINDLFGHNAGDEVLQQVCTRVNTLLSEPMSMGRVGGDEFVIVMPDTRVKLARLICQGVVATIGGSPYRVGERAFHVRGSVGLIEVGAGTSIKDAVATADRACREAKAGHADGLVVFEKNARAFLDHEAEMRLVERLSASADISGLFVEMQPIMSLRKPRASLNFEVLLRMQDENGNRIPTDRLIAAGENSGRMGVIDRWVLSHTLQWIKTHQASLGATQFVCMNLSGASLNDERFIDDVFDALERNIDIARHICLEITESVALHDLKNTRRFIDRVREYGAKVALDDFGAGYTSFSYLKDLPGDLLKIDGSFIVNMNQHPANIAIVEAIVNLAQNLGMKTIAEWAEDAETVQTLAEIGVDYVQGYVVARPQAPDAILGVHSSADFIPAEGDMATVLDALEKLSSTPDLFLGTPADQVH